MTTADTDEDLDQEIPQGETPADPLEQTHEDTLDERLPEDAEPADADKDGTDEVQDPLLLAQMDAAEKPKDVAPTGETPKPKPAAPKTEKPKAETPKPKVDENPKPDDDQQTAQADLKAAQERLPAEDWSKLSHKSKSQILTMQRIARESNAAAEKAKADAEEASKDYNEVDQFRQRHKLEPKEFMQAVSLGGAIKSGNKDVIPFLEQTLESLKKHHGIEVAKTEAEVKIETYGIDPDELVKLAEGAENFDLEAINKLKALATKAKEAKAKVATPPPAKPAAPTPAKQPIDHQQSQTNQAEVAEFTAIHEALSALGVTADDMEAHTVQLIKDITGGDSKKLPAPGTRLRAIVEAHTRRIQATKSPAKPRASVPPPPMSGRTGTTRQAVTPTDPSTVDPLKIAFKR